VNQAYDRGSNARGRYVKSKKILVKRKMGGGGGGIKEKGRAPLGVCTRSSEESLKKKTIGNKKPAWWGDEDDVREMNIADRSEGPKRLGLHAR